MFNQVHDNIQGIRQSPGEAGQLRRRDPDRELQGQYAAQQAQGEDGPGEDEGQSTDNRNSDNSWLVNLLGN